MTVITLLSVTLWETHFPTMEHVNRGVCKVGKTGLLEEVVETRKISKTENGIFAPGPDGKELNSPVKNGLYEFVGI
jgi:hypothetical protein